MNKKEDWKSLQSIGAVKSIIYEDDKKSEYTRYFITSLTVNEFENKLKKLYNADIFMNAIYYKVKEDEQIVVKTAYIVLGVNMNEEKEVIEIWIRANE